MPANRTILRSALGAAAGLPLLALAAAASAQDAPADAGPMSEEEVRELPREYRTGPVPMSDVTETSVGPDGVETITRTRRIESAAPPAGETYQGHANPAPAYPGYPPQAPTPVVFEREQWLEECRRRTEGRDEREKGGIIGALLGAITGGIIGNRVADGERLAGTLIGAGTGGLAGLLLGNLIGWGKKNDRYDCEAALDSYISQYGYPASGPARIASRTIPAPYPPAGYAPSYQPAYGYGYPAYSYAPAYGYAPPPQMVMVPVRYEQQQRVIVRENVREESVPAARSIPESAPRPVPIPRPAPSPKMIKGD